MKKFVAILLSLLLCLSFVACGGTDGDATNPDVREEFIGEWVNICWDDKTSLVIESKSDVKIEENTAIVNGITYDIDIRNGITHLIIPNDSDFFDYVKIEDTTYSEIEITLDNWQEYFEIIPKPLIEKNSFGDIVSTTLFYCFEPKDNIKSKIVRTDNENVIGIEIISDYKPTAFEYGENDQIIIKPDTPVSSFAPSVKDNITTKDIKVSYLCNENNDAIYLKQLVGGGKISDGVIFNHYNIRLTRIIGKLKLYENPLF